jgi:hypothetical protein
VSLRLDWCRLVPFPQLTVESLCRRVSGDAGYSRGHRAPIEHRGRQSVLDRRPRRGSGEGDEEADSWSAGAAVRLHARSWVVGQMSRQVLLTLRPNLSLAASATCGNAVVVGQPLTLKEAEHRSERERDSRSSQVPPTCRLGGMMIV